MWNDILEKDVLKIYMQLSIEIVNIKFWRIYDVFITYEFCFFIKEELKCNFTLIILMREHIFDICINEE